MQLWYLCPCERLRGYLFVCVSMHSVKMLSQCKYWFETWSQEHITFEIIYNFYKHSFYIIDQQSIENISVLLLGYLNDKTISSVILIWNTTMLLLLGVKLFTLKTRDYMTEYIHHSVFERGNWTFPKLFLYVVKK